MLLTLTVQYFQGKESIGERSTCIVMGFTYMIISMMVLIVDENKLELGLENAYNSFNQSASVFLTKQGLSSSGPASKIVLKFFMAVWCGLLGALFTFPGMRIAKMHWDLLKYFRENKIKQILLNISFALPFILVIFWIKPVSRDYLTSRIFTGFTKPLYVEQDLTFYCKILIVFFRLTDHAFETIRLITIVSTMCLKVILMPWYLQAYLDMAYHRTEEQKKEAGRITNIDYQKKIAAVFYYLCVVTLQYVAPVIMCLYLTLMYKTLGDYSWSGLFKDPQTNLNECSVNSAQRLMESIEKQPDSISKSAAEFHLALDNLKSVN